MISCPHCGGNKIVFATSDFKCVCTKCGEIFNPPDTKPKKGMRKIAMKEFLKENDHLQISIQHLGIYGGCFKVEVFNTTFDCGLEPVFRHYILDQELDILYVDFDTAILTPIKIWLEDLKESCEKENKND